jgi:hypothetical protein
MSRLESQDACVVLLTAADLGWCFWYLLDSACQSARLPTSRRVSRFPAHAASNDRFGFQRDHRRRRMESSVPATFAQVRERPMLTDTIPDHPLSALRGVTSQNGTVVFAFRNYHLPLIVLTLKKLLVFA